MLQDGDSNPVVVVNSALPPKSANICGEPLGKLVTEESHLQGEMLKLLFHWTII